MVLGTLLLIGVLIWDPVGNTRAQSGASPVASPVAGLALPGATVQTLASGNAGQLPAAAPLTLERVTLPPGATTGMRQLPAPELVVVVFGTLTLTDSLGLSNT